VPADDLFDGGGNLGRLMAATDWAATPMGPVDGWPQSLRAAVRIVLSSRYPMLLLWGPEFTQLYNDAYSALIGDKHPAALGGDVRVTLAEGWDVLQPLIADAMATGVASWVPALQLLLERAGYREEAYFSVSHAPARDDAGRTVGVLTVCSEVTEQVVGQRRLRLLREVSLAGGARAAGLDAVCGALTDAIGEHPLDVPFAAIYLREGRSLRLAAYVGADGDGRPVATHLPAAAAIEPGGDDPWGLRAAAAGMTVRLDDVAPRVTVPGGPWGDPVRTVVVQPLPSAEDEPLGVLVTGVSPSRGLDDVYASFVDLLAQQVAVPIRNTRAYEQERRRAEALAELDRAKTDFFTNVSHEFRTPLTLLLGPLADALTDRQEPLAAAQRARIETASRNATRLLGLVNDLLTFASLEAGRSALTRRDVDLAQLTADLAGIFRSAVERASLKLVVECPPLDRPAAVDPGNWENIVTNLISNALKFTFVGEIRVRLESDDTEVRLSVADTGIGIAPEELAHLFDRFHRVQGVRSRSHEGTGIGLALVRELVQLQGGAVHVDSVQGRGTTFTVTLPWTALAPVATAPADGDPVVGDTAKAAAREAMTWMAEPGVEHSAPGPEPAGAPDDGLAGARILVADDNSDMRAYLTRLLAAQAWEVQAVADGRAALDAVRRRPPDLLLTDVMMPQMDGFQLVRALRQDEATATLPIVVLSARAGREAGVEGLELGADDYVVKPFTAAELVARIRTTLQLARLRSVHTRRLSALAETAALIASGRALEDAFQAATEQTRALLGGVRAVTVLDADDHRAPLRFAAAPAGASRPGPTEPVEAAIVGRDQRRIGRITVEVDAGRPPGDDVRLLLTSVATMLASLAENSWQIEHDHQVALTLQQSLLPENLPEVDGWELAAQYLPATGDIGGDWYDVVALPDGDVLLAIGDVAGHGLGSAVTMGQIRNAVRAYAVEGPSPAGVLARLTALLDSLGTPFYATLFLARLTPATGALTWCNAGHPPPVRCVPGGSAQWLAGPVGPPLGLSGAVYRESSTVLAPGMRLLLYTDGLVEDRRQPLDVGLDRVLSRATGACAGDVGVRRLMDAVLADVADARPDDVAVVAVHRRAVPAPVPPASVADMDRAWAYPLVPTAAAAMRRDLRAALAGGVDDDLLDDLLLAASEAVNNAVEHAQQPARPEVAVRLSVAGGVVRLTVRDYGSWRGRQPAMDRGRGALLMNAYGEVRVTSTSTGTLVTIERRIGSRGPALPSSGAT
jgi:signal transduction histidine kinase/CheY-like chemotaxis protein